MNSLRAKTRNVGTPSTMKQRAYTDILNRILDGRYSPGHLLNRRGVAQELRMSPAPVHEAMIELECAGLVEALPRLGTRVRHARVEDLRGHLIVREALECQAARMICGDPVRSRLEILRPIAENCPTPSAPVTKWSFISPWWKTGRLPRIAARVSPGDADRVVLPHQSPDADAGRGTGQYPCLAA